MEKTGLMVLLRRSLVGMVSQAKHLADAGGGLKPAGRRRKLFHCAGEGIVKAPEGPGLAVGCIRRRVKEPGAHLLKVSDR